MKGVKNKKLYLTARHYFDWFTNKRTIWIPVFKLFFVVQITTMPVPNFYFFMYCKIITMTDNLYYLIGNNIYLILKYPPNTGFFENYLLYISTGIY